MLMVAGSSACASSGEGPNVGAGAGGATAKAGLGGTSGLLGSGGGAPAECNGAVDGAPCGQGSLTNCGPPCDPDPCISCAVLRCDPSGTWKKSYLPTAICLQCGAGLHCVQASNFCRITGPAPSSTAKYECAAIPEGCSATNRTCACLEAANPGYTCKVFHDDFTLQKP